MSRRDSVTQMLNGKSIDDPGCDIDAAGHMSGKRDPGFDVLRRSKGVKQATNFCLDDDFNVDGPGRECWCNSTWSCPIRPEYPFDSRGKIPSYHAIGDAAIIPREIDSDAFVTNPRFGGRMSTGTRRNYGDRSDFPCGTGEVRWIWNIAPETFQFTDSGTNYSLMGMSARANHVKGSSGSNYRCYARLQYSGNRIFC